MQRNDVLREIAALVRGNHWAGCFAVGYLARDASTEVLEDLAAALRESPGPRDTPDHLKAYEERWGPLAIRPR